MVDYNILQHFQPEEEHFIEQVRDWQRQVEVKYTPVLTPFLNPRKQRILSQIIGNNDDCLILFNGGFDTAESQRALLYPSYYEPAETDFDLSIIQLNYAHKFNQLSHSQILGTILGLGIARNRLGDIVTDGSQWQLIIDKSLADLLPMQITKMGGTPVKFELIFDKDRLIKTQIDWQEKEVSISSFRLDTFISEASNISRQKAKDIIESGLVKRNWIETSQPRQAIEVGDMISVRQFGRMRFDEVMTETKKGKFRIRISTLRSK